MDNNKTKQNTEKYQSLFIFSLHGVHYAVATEIVRESVMLPELKPMEEVPPHVAGVVNLRGKVAPVMDLDILFGYKPEEYNTSDKVIFLEAEGVLAGIIASEVLDVRSIPVKDIEFAPLRHRQGERHTHFLAGEVKVEEDIVMLLDHQSLVRGLESMEEERPEEALRGGAPRQKFCPEAGPEAKKVFQKRARELMLPVESEDLAGFKALAVVSLNSEYYGVDLASVREFSKVGVRAPVPCTPDHILGAMNLRGDILPLVDIRGLLHMSRGEEGSLKKLVVVHFADLFAGVLVKDILEVVYVPESEVGGIPAAVESAKEEFLIGSVPYEGKMMGILDIEKVLTKEGVAVNEEV